MSQHDFLKRENILMLWEIISDNELIKEKSKQEFESFKEFLNNITPQFYETEKKLNTNLMNMNKKFLEYIFLILKKDKIKKNDKLSITNEQIKEKRMSQFDSDFSKMKNDFDRSMTLPIPETPKFSDNLDTPIEEIDTVVKRMTAQRNMELNQLYSGVNKEDVEKWLKPAETSIKTEKLSHNYDYKQNNKQNTEIKYIKINNDNIDNNIFKNDIIDLNEREKLYDNPQKQISWGKNEIHEYSNTISLDIKEVKPNSDDIFSKFKKINSPNVLNSFVDEDTRKENNSSDFFEKKLNDIQEQIKNLNKTLETYMDKCNNTLTIIYSMITKQEKELLKLIDIKEDIREKEIVHPENINSNILL